MWTTSFHALTTDIAIECDDRALFDSLRSLTDTYRPAAADPELVYRFVLADGALFRGARRLCHGVGAIDLVPIFEFDFYQQVVDRCPGFIVHAGCVSDGARAVLLAGDSGAGKSTLTSALVARGARYVTDECTAIAADGSARGLSRPIGLKGGGAAVGELARSVYEFRKMDGDIDTHTLLHPAEDAIAREPVPLAAILLIRYAPTEPPSRANVAPSTALELLWTLRRGGSPEAFMAALAVVERIPVYALVTSTIDGACRDVITTAGLRL